MRVIAGELKGRRLRVPKTRAAVRPTTDRVREALFSRLENMISLEGTFVLDLFAGSGSLGMEAISRGARFVIFVEEDKTLSENITRNLVEFGVSDRAQVLSAKVEKILPRLKEFMTLVMDGKQFDIVFLDPPYAVHPGTPLGGQLAEYDLIKQGTMFVTESDRNISTNLAEITTPTGLVLERLHEKDYGATRLSFFRFS